MLKDEEQLIRAATDEIWGSISCAETGNYWIKPNWNLFCQKGLDVNMGEVVGTYCIVKLEEYDETEECLFEEWDFQDTESLSAEEVEIAIRAIIGRNQFLLS